MRKFLVILAVLLIAAAGIIWWQTSERPAQAQTQASLLPLLSEEDTAGFARATEPGAVEFPRDLGPHPDFQVEWWYYTGNLHTADGRRFGYQLTFFRRALPSEQEMSGGQSLTTTSRSPSAWRPSQIYLAHFTVTDVDGEAFYVDERFSRGALGLAGAQAEPYHVWLEDWSVEQVEPFDNGVPDVVRLTAQAEEVAIDLRLKTTMPPILHGDAGLSSKGPEEGNASYYYSIVQQETSGMVTVHDETFSVTGISWKDHEYSTSALSPGAIGWDWFSLQLDNGAALMFFQIRREDGTLQRESSGTFIYPDGRTEHVTLEMWNVEVTDTWTSPHSGAEYPAGWRIRIPQLDLVLEGRPWLADQELNVSTVYWEGAVAFQGTWQGRDVTASGYIELTGYAEAMQGRL
ncbi:MAG TPA: lipocalin-like domain-containing protein [Candidatus Binatia bacterium]|nr:lipocalin-like domain-containing protein [Candidatus Binatia bacterium]